MDLFCNISSAVAHINGEEIKQFYAIFARDNLRGLFKIFNSSCCWQQLYISFPSSLFPCDKDNYNFAHFLNTIVIKLWKIFFFIKINVIQNSYCAWSIWYLSIWYLSVYLLVLIKLKVLRKWKVIMLLFTISLYHIHMYYYFVTFVFDTFNVFT